MATEMSGDRLGALNPSPTPLPESPRRRRGLVTRLWLAVAVLAAAAGGAFAFGGTATAAPVPVEGPAGDAFYQPPSPLPAGSPGDVIRYRKQVDFGNASNYLVLYRSTNALGQPIAVSGTILVPKGKNPATMPVVGFASGTAGMGDNCAPSKNNWYTALQLGNALDRGFRPQVRRTNG